MPFERHQAGGGVDEICDFVVNYYEMGVSKDVGLKGRRFATKSGHIGCFY